MENTPKGNQGSEKEVRSAEKILTKIERDETSFREEVLNKVREQAISLGIDEKMQQEMLDSFRHVTGSTSYKGPFEVNMKGKRIEFFFGRTGPADDMHYLSVDGLELSEGAYRKFAEKYGELFHTLYELVHYNKFKEELDEKQRNPETRDYPDYLIDDLL